MKKKYFLKLIKTQIWHYTVVQLVSNTDVAIIFDKTK